MTGPSWPDPKDEFDAHVARLMNESLREERRRLLFDTPVFSFDEFVKRMTSEERARYVVPPRRAPVPPPPHHIRYLRYPEAYEPPGREIRIKRRITFQKRIVPRKKTIVIIPEGEVPREVSMT